MCIATSVLLSQSLQDNILPYSLKLHLLNNPFCQGCSLHIAFTIHPNHCLDPFGRGFSVLALLHSQNQHLTVDSEGLMFQWWNHSQLAEFTTHKLSPIVTCENICKSPTCKQFLEFSDHCHLTLLYSFSLFRAILNTHRKLPCSTVSYELVDLHWCAAMVVQAKHVSSMVQHAVHHDEFYNAHMFLLFSRSVNLCQATT